MDKIYNFSFGNSTLCFNFAENIRENNATNIGYHSIGRVLFILH